MMNLHVYSQYSGKEYLPPEKQLLQEYECGNTVLSITDHNCVRANPIAQTMSEEYGFLYIPGIEIDCTYENRNISVIGYGIDAGSRDFEEVDINADNVEYSASIERLCETQAMGFRVTESDMWNVARDQYHPGNWTGKMFAEVLFSKPEYFSHPILQKYRLSSKNEADCYEAFDHDFYTAGALCHVKTDYMNISEAVSVIHQNGGKAVIYCPGYHRIDSGDIKKLSELEIDFIDFDDNYFMECRKKELFSNLSGCCILNKIYH